MQQLKVKEIEELLKETMSAYMTTGDDTVLHTIIAQANTDSRASVQALAKRYQNKLEKIQKEQEKKIEELEKVKPLVRCKDCRWHDNSTGECSNIDSICWRNGCAMDDFYCAEGERK